MIIIDGMVFSLQGHGGVSVYIHQLLRHLSREGHAAECLVEEPLQQQLENTPPGIEIVRRRARRLERYRSCRVFSAGSIFHTSYYRRCADQRIPSVVTVYDFVYERWFGGPGLWVHREQKRAAIRSAQAVICISQSTKNDLLEFVGETPGQDIHVIHCGVGHAFRPTVIDPPAVPYILHVGYRTGYKNFKQLLAAMAWLPDFELHCVGGGAFTANEFDGVPSAVAKRVRHLGFVTDEQLNVLYCGATCLVYPSLYEGFGIPVLEALSAGCPVVSTNCTAVLEVGLDALTVVFDRDPQGMANAVRHTVSGERAALVQRGLEVARGCSWDTRHRQTLDVYRSLGADLTPQVPFGSPLLRTAR